MSASAARVVNGIPLRRLTAATTAGAVAGGLLLAASASPARAETEPLAAAICVSGTQGKFARLAILDEDRNRLKVFHLRKGCRFFRAGVELPAGNYIVRHRAPKGMLTGRVIQSTATCNDNGECLGGGVSLDRKTVPLRKVKSAEFSLYKNQAGSVSFQSVKNPRR